MKCVSFLVATLILFYIFFFVLGESIPIRLFLAGYELTPTFKDVNKKFSVRYFLNLVLVDEEERRYFKQQVCHSYYNSKKTDCKLLLNNVLHSKAVALFVISISIFSITSCSVVIGTGAYFLLWYSRVHIVLKSP